MYSSPLFYSYSDDGRSWSGDSAQVKAESDTGAIEQVKSKYPYVKDIRITGRRPA